jgi:hypothetical protein
VKLSMGWRQPNANTSPVAAIRKLALGMLMRSVSFKLHRFLRDVIKGAA